MKATILNGSEYKGAFPVTPKVFSSGSEGLYGTLYLGAFLNAPRLVLADDAGAVVVDCPLPRKVFASGAEGFWFGEVVATEEGLFRFQAQVIKKGKAKHAIQVLLLPQ